MENDNRYDINEIINIISNNGIESSLAIISAMSYVKLRIINNKKIKNDIKLDKKMKLNKNTKINIEKKKTNEDLEIYNIFLIEKKVNGNTDLYDKYFENFNKNLKRILPENIYALTLKKLFSVSIDEISKKEYIKDYPFLAKACYSAYSHKVTLVKNKEDVVEATLAHELLHAVSAYISFKENMNSCGFSKFIVGDTRYGDGLNEGYTEYLNEKYFSDSDSYSYLYESEVASIVEDIVGPKMVEYYFTNDTYNLIKTLSKYSSKDQSIRFILNLDFINRHLINNNIPLSNKTKIEINNYYMDVKKYLLTIYINKSIKENIEMDKEILSKIKNLKNKQYNVKSKTFQLKK